MSGSKRSRVLFVGFHGAADGSTPQSQNELVAALLADHFDVRSGSKKARQVARLVDQLMLVIRNVRWAEAIVVDVFSGRRAWTPVLVTRIARLVKIPTILVLHGGGLPQYVKGHAWLIDSTLRLASSIVAPSPYLKRSFEARGFTVTEVPNLVDLPVSRSDRAMRAPSRKVLWMRAFDREYQPLLAVEVIARLIQTHPGARLTMAGPDRGMLNQVRRTAGALGVSDRVDFPGYLDTAKKMAAMRDHDAFLNTTSIDNTPVSVLEALASGLPVVATDVGGMADLLDGGHAGLLVADGDVIAIAAALDDVLEDKDLRERLVRAGYEVAKKFSPDSVISSWRSVLEDVGVHTSSAGPSPTTPSISSDARPTYGPLKGDE